MKLPRLKLASLATATTLSLLTLTSIASDPTLEAHYPFNGNANDESGNAHHGTVNGALLTTDRFGAAASAYQFNGVTDFIDCGNAASLNIGTGSLTLSAWVKFNAPQVDKYIVGKYNALQPKPNAYGLGTG